MQQVFLVGIELVEHLGALVEKIVQQLRRHDRVVGGEITAPGQHNIGQHSLGKVVMQVAPQ